MSARENEGSTSSPSEAKREALARLLKSRMQDGRTFPLSSSQQALWFQQRVQPENTAYNIPLAFVINGELNADVLRRSLELVRERHNVLSVVFFERDGEPVQNVIDPGPLDLPVRDLVGSIGEDWHEHVLRLSHEQAREPIDLARGPMWRLELARIAPTRHVLLITIHHIVLDGWSIGLLLREFTEIYLALAAGEPPRLADLPVRYDDFVRRERAKLQGIALDAQVEYWRRRLEGAPLLLELPADHARPLAQSFRGASHSFLLPAVLVDRLKALGRRQGATLFMTMLASFYALLYRLTDASDIVLGVAIANRERQEHWGLLGLFSNTVPMRAEFSGDMRFSAFLEQVRTQALEDYANTDVPVTRLVEALNPTRDPNRSLLFQVGFDFQNSPWPTHLGEDVIWLVNGDNGATKLDLNLALSEGERGLSALIEYSTDLFDVSTIQRFESCYRVLLDSLLADPDARISTLPLLDDAQMRERALHSAGPASLPTAIVGSGADCLHTLFERQAAANPDAIALIQGPLRWTYRELDERASHIARKLSAIGIGAEDRVGLWSQRCPGQIAAVIGVLKSGACYVPLEPALPTERLAQLLGDAGVRVVLSVGPLLQRWLGPPVELVDFDFDGDEAAAAHCQIACDPAMPAYLIYTSGSSGRPKGVLATHAGVVNHALASGREFALDPRDRVLQFASLSFDASAEEIFPCLAHGATLVLRDDAMLGSVATFVRKVAQWRITVLDLPTAYWHEWVAAMDADDLELPPELRLVIIGGEAARMDTVRRWDARVGGRIRLLNTYGPTEATIVASSQTLVAEQIRTATAPIGRAIENVSIHVVDRHMRPVPVGIYGELLIGGAGVARGYLGRPDLTAEKFIPDPFAVIPGRRLYRSGDIGRYLADGTIEFKGRIDSQIKLRGFRIEPGEIEETLLLHPDIARAVVALRELRPGDRRLAAYLVARDGCGIDSQAVRNWLRERLPEYMVPAFVVPLDAVPLTASGKIDHRALAELSPQAAVDLGRSIAAPRTPAEEMMARIWAEILGLERVGVYENFFELGGHSLLATQVLSRVRRTMDVDIPLHALFEAPTVASLVQVVEEARRTQQGQVTSEIRVLPRTAAEQLFPQSFAQQRLWFLEQLEPGTAAYNLPSAVRLRGALDLAALESSLNEIVRRHEVLRTCFQTYNELPVQVVAPSLQVPLEIFDLSGLDADEREAQVERLVDEEAHRPFDLSVCPLLRMQVLRLDEQEHVLLFTMHHIISDGWSMGVLVQELSVLYSAFRHGESSPLSELELQYADFSHWQRDWLTGDRLQRQIDYWRDRLEGAPAYLELPTDRQRVPTRSLKGARAVRVIDASLTSAIKRCSQAQSVTPFMLLLAAFDALLHRYSGQTDIVVGTPIANRHRADLEPLIGFFVNTLVMRTDLSGDPSFTELVGRVRETALGAYAHQDLPFEQLVETLGSARRWSGTPLFRVMFVLQNAPMPPLQLQGLSVDSVEIDSRTTKFDLTIELVEQGDELIAIAQYSADLFDAETMERLLRHYQRLLQAVASAPETRLSALPLLAQDESERLLYERNRTAADLDATPVYVLFERHAATAPEALAIAGGGARWSYAEVNAEANRLARHLRAQDIGASDIVAICAEHSPAWLVSALAVLKAGAAYLPLDPAYPADRLEYIVADAGAALLLTDVATHARLPELRLPTLCTDQAQGALADRSDANLEPAAEPGQLAYLIYTSGSTGRPKGVAVEHRALSNLAAWHRRSYAVTAQDRASWLAGVAFDASVWELWGHLSAGASVHVAAESTRLDPPALLDWLVAERIDLAFLPTPLAEAVLELEWPAHSSLRVLLTGGDLLHRGPRADAPFALYNHYGPTETAVVATWAKVGETEADVLPPIGAPLTNVRVYVLDEAGLPAPDGVTGELYIGGAGLARGYWNRPELTAERFVPDAFSGEVGARLYRTGDRVRYRGDGLLEFVGRTDTQIKVRGYRIEPGEIEAALYEQAEVRRAVVVARETGTGEKRLVAYVERGSNRPSAQALREELRQRLPEFMVPAAIMFLEALPQTAHGKIDRDALPEPEGLEAQRGYAAPRTPLEETLCRIWEEVLRLPRVGLDDNFFELGGHSLLATQVVSRIRKVLEREVPLRGLFEEPTVRGLAGGIERRRWQDKGGGLPPLTAMAREPGTQVHPQSFAQQRLWFLDQLEPGNSTYNIPSAVRLRGRLNREGLEAALNGLIARHDSLRTSFAWQDDALMQIVQPALGLPMAVCDLQELAQEEREAQVRALAQEEGGRPFDLKCAPLLRATLLVLGPEEHVLLFTIHHIISDGWSMGVLVRELSALYSAHCEQGPYSLEPLPISASDFFRRQQTWLDGGELQSQLDYWSERLRGAPPLLDLPTDRPRSAARSGRGATVHTVLAPALAESLTQLAQREGATLFMVLAATFNLLLGRYADMDDIVVGTPIANRHWHELESLVGHFTNALALRTDLSGDPSFRDLLRRVRDGALGAYAHQDLPFEKLVEHIGSQHRDSRTPVFQVMFVLQNAPMPPLELSGLESSAVDVSNASAMFDLTLEVVEHAYGMVAAFQYSTDLFDEDRMRRMLGHFERLLEAAVADPSARISLLPMLTPAERHALVHTRNADAIELPEHEPMQAAFERQAAMAPDRIAVADDGTRLSYRELDGRANRLARWLRHRGVGRESRVGIYLSRTTSMMVAVLAVLKAGAAYVALDPAYPADRLRFILGDAAVAAVVTSPSLAARLPQDCPCIVPETDAQAIEAMPDDALGLDFRDAQLAYIIYTSGSTGTPKGVMLTHRNATAFLRWSSRHFDREALAEVLASTSLCFDLSVFELFAPLSCGGMARIVENALELTPVHTVTLVNTVPSIMSELLHFGLLPPSLRTVNLAGEALPPALVRRIHEWSAQVRLLNLYGPSEDTTYSTWCEVSADADGAPPIGVAIANSQAYVLDSAMQPVPVGVAGELWLGGEGLARGYLARPDLTAERFVPDPLSGRAGARLYRTGDLARWLADGKLDYLGRGDYQVKIRGCRIELGEVEAALATHPAVSKVAVAVVGDELDARRLAAYVVAEDVPAPILLSWVRDLLPEYMVPASVVFLEAMPLNANGKIDRAALPAAETAAPRTARASVPASTPAERLIAGIWAEMLKVEKVGLHDGFFELGGHSLLATRILSRLCKVTQVEIPLRQFFEAPTVAGLLGHAAAQSGGRSAIEDVAELYFQVREMDEDAIRRMLVEEEAG